MARIHSIAQDAVLVAIDISKKRNDVLIQMPGSPRRRRLVVLKTSHLSSNEAILRLLLPNFEKMFEFKNVEIEVKWK